MDAARKDKALTEQRLSFERGSGAPDAMTHITFDLTLLAQATVDAFRGSMNRANVEVAFRTSHRHVHLRGDKVLFREALLNLLENCAAQSGTDLRVVEVEIVCDAEQVVVTVRDDGVGIRRVRQRRTV